MTRIDIISGFLGAGKTTLIKQLLEQGAYGDEKIVLIENEFGEIGIDGGFLKESGVQISEMNSGCICCSLVGDFQAALRDVIAQYAPQRVIIEPSGVGKLSDVIRAVQAVTDENTVLNTFSVVVDAVKCKMFAKNFGEFFLDQVKNAHCLILSRTQLLTAEKLQATVELLRGYNDKAAIVTTPWEQLDAMQIVAAMEHSVDMAQQLLKEMELCPVCGHHHEEDDCCATHEHEHDHEHDHEHGHDHEHEHDNEHHHDHDHDHEHEHEHEHDHHHHHHHHHHADDVFTNFGVETPVTVSKETLENALQQLSAENSPYGTVLRAKGMLPDESGVWHHFDLTPGEYEIRRGSAEYTGKLCVIGTDLKEADIRLLFGI